MNFHRSFILFVASQFVLTILTILRFYYSVYLIPLNLLMYLSFYFFMLSFAFVLYSLIIKFNRRSVRVFLSCYIIFVISFFVWFQLLDYLTMISIVLTIDLILIIDQVLRFQKYRRYIVDYNFKRRAFGNILPYIIILGLLFLPNIVGYFSYSNAITKMTFTSPEQSVIFASRYIYNHTFFIVYSVLEILCWASMV